MSWHRLTSGVVEVVPIPGDHITLLEGGNAYQLAAALGSPFGAGSTARHPPLVSSSCDGAEESSGGVSAASR